MGITKAALANPTAVIAAILLLLLFGIISLFRLPVQMIPDIERPTIQIVTTWRSAAPDEVEAEIIEPQEDALRGLPGLEKIESSANEGFASIDLRFTVDSQLQRSLVEVINRMNRVPSYPPDADEPQIFAGTTSFGNSIAWFSLKPKEDGVLDIVGYKDFVDEVVGPRLERIPGVANSNNYGGRDREVRITFDPYQLAALNVQMPEVIANAGGNVDISAGATDVGRRQYVVRFAGRYDLAEFSDMIVTWRDGAPVRLRDVATVELTMVDTSGILSVNGGQAIAVNAQPEPGVNVLAVMTQIKEAVAELNAGPVGRQGLVMQLLYDETLYINDSIGMLRNNLLLGIALAVAVLWLFLRRVRATLVVGVAIPISLFVAFSALDLGGRSLNIISLAGLAFAMGVVLDAAIVVLENIVRLRESGERGLEAAAKGAGQVWPALLASTATTVAIFLPILFMRDIAGQLFGDLAFAIAVAVITSLVIAITVVPAASVSWLRGQFREDRNADFWDRGAAFVMRLTATPARRGAWIVGLVGIALAVVAVLLPKADYLPEGRQNFVRGIILPPPGQSVEAAKEEFVDIVNARLREHIDGDAEPPIDYYFMGIFGSFGFLGVRTHDRDEIDDLLGQLNGRILRGFPDTIAFASRSSIFGRLGGGRVIEMNIQSRDLDATLNAARVGMGAVATAFADARVQPVPGVELAQPELRLIPNEARIAETGWNRRTLASVIRALGDGLYLGDYFDGDQRLDIILRAQAWRSPEELAALPLATPIGTVPLGELVRVERTAGPEQIRRVDRRRTVTLRVTPPSDMALEEAIDRLRRDVEPAVREALPADGDIAYYGSADNLSVALRNMSTSLLLAIVILYLLISALFRSFKDGLLVVLTLPLAVVGGVVALRLTDWTLRLTGSGIQPMDLLTMIGFITLLGLVVNNAILLVHQTRQSEREGQTRRDAVARAVRLRMRPILMSTLTTLFGMLPLLVVPGAGTELYRGLAAVIVGGMSVSTLFTLVLLPSLLRLGEERSVIGEDPQATGHYV